VVYAAADQTMQQSSALKISNVDCVSVVDMLLYDAPDFDSGRDYLAVLIGL